MLAVNVQTQGDKVVIAGLQSLASDLNGIVQGSMKKVARGVHRYAMDFLNGPGGLNTYETRTSKKGNSYQKKTGSKVEQYEGFTRSTGDTQMFKRFTDSGGYPVPVRTGNLKRLLFFVDPGATVGRNFKNETDTSIQAGPMEVVVYDSAEYARVIHEGLGSSAKFRPRRFLDDALAKFNAGNGIATTIEADIDTAIKKRGLA